MNITIYFIFGLILIGFSAYHFITLDSLKKLFNEVKNENKNLKVENEKLKNKNNSLITQIKQAFETGRFGYYITKTNLLSDNDKKNNLPGESYESIIYVKELDRYTNGMSKIEIVKIEVTSGFQIDQYSWIKEAQTERFSSIKKTSDIEWLESETSLKELRKEKLNKILNQ